MSEVIAQPKTIDVGGRTVGFYEYGDPNGRPVFVFHGTPACGAGFAWADESARSLGLHLVAPDRPGVGLSARVDSYRVCDYAPQVAALADAMRVEQFAVWGYSGGGPYAVACAAQLGSRVQHAAVAAGMGQIDEWARREEFEKTDRQMLGLVATKPWAARAILGFTGRLARLAPGTAYKSFAKQVSPSDRAAAESIGSPREVMALFTQAFVHGSAGVVADYAALDQRWGIDTATITAPMTIWHGDADPMVPLTHSEALAARVPHARLTVWPGEGHLATVTHVNEILAAVAADL